jgi:addiction module RelE/StbE family toxin
VVAIRWAFQATEDLKSISDYIAADSEEAAESVIRELVDAADRLQLFPNMGRVLPEHRNPNVRELICRSYRIVYKVTEDCALILTVFHQARLFDEDTLT